jgi:hypothetical protein
MPIIPNRWRSAWPQGLSLEIDTIKTSISALADILDSKGFDTDGVRYSDADIDNRDDMLLDTALDAVEDGDKNVLEDAEEAAEGLVQRFYNGAAGRAFRTLTVPAGGAWVTFVASGAQGIDVVVNARVLVITTGSGIVTDTVVVPSGASRTLSTDQGAEFEFRVYNGALQVRGDHGAQVTIDAVWQ